MTTIKTYLCKKLAFKMALLGFIMTGLVSCSDFLKETSMTEITADLVLDNPEGIKSAVAGLYAIYRSYYTHQDAGLSAIRGTDIEWSRGAHDMGAARYDQAMNPTNSVVLFNWRTFYQLIERANAIIASTEKVELSDEDKKQVLGEAHGFRAISYYYLIRWFDNIILTTEQTTSIGKTYAPAPPADIWNLILSDLEIAIENLNYTTEQPGRLTKGFVQHLLADVALWQNNWPLAEEMAKEAIANGPHRLLDNIETIFSGSALDHEEGLFVVQYQEGVVGGGDSGHRWAMYFTAQSYNVNGVKTDHAQGGRAWARTHPNDYLLGLYEAEEDQRLEVYYRRYYYFNDEANLPEGKQLGDTVTRDDVGNPYPSIMPSCTKYWDNQRDITSAYSHKNIIVSRLAETYLIAAEALMRQNRVEEALNYINPIRLRAGIDPLETLDQDVLLEERARELAFEGHRWFALKRMGVLVERVRLHGGNEDGGYTHPRQNIQDFHVRRPIPQNELNLMPGYPQNEGYN